MTWDGSGFLFAVRCWLAPMAFWYMPVIIALRLVEQTGEVVKARV